jgi:hypothetical protein
MLSSGMLRRAALVRTVVSDKLIAFIIKDTEIGELGTTLAVTSNQNTSQRNLVPSSPIPVTLMMEAIHAYDTSVLTTTARCNIPEDGVLS